MANAIKINKKNMIKIDENDKITIKLQLLRSMSAKLDGEKDLHQLKKGSEKMIQLV